MELNALGKYLLVSLFFVVAAMIEFAVILLLKRTKQEKEDDKSTIIKRNSGPLQVVTKASDAPSWMSMQSRRRFIPRMQIIKKKWMDFNFSTNKIDIFAFIICLSFYFIFNCAYWMHYARV